MLLRCSNVWRNQSQRASKQSSLFHILYPCSKMFFLLLTWKENLVILQCLFLFSQCLEMKERSQVTVRNQRPTTAGNYLEYFVPFALSMPWSAAGAVKITGCRQDSESICTNESKVHSWAPTPAILHLLFSDDKNLEKRSHPNS